MGPAPIGWPDAISWEGFSGTTRSKLNKEEITGIIISMLTTVGIDPDQHVVNAGAVLVEDEQDPDQADPMGADVGNEEDTEPDNRDEVDANENMTGIKRRFGS